jgi:dTDP-4-amino-4,6-dideoxygalactose transaminase
MNVPIIEFTRHYATHRAAIDAAVHRTLDSGWYLLGKEAEGFEAEFSGYLGSGVATVGVANGTDALTLALRAMGVGPGDDVLCPAMTATATPMAIRLAGATPIFVDVLPETLCIDPDDVRKKLTERTKAIVPVHLYGNSAEIDALLALGIPLLEDCAQASGTYWRGQHVGTFGTAAAFSFYPTKNLGAFGDAGAVVSKDPALLAHVRQLRSYGEPVRYHADEEGMNSRMDELQAAILRAKLPHLDDAISRRRALAARYRERLDPAIVQVPSDSPGHSYHLFVVRSNNRDALQEHLKRRGVGTTIHYPVAQNRQRAFEKLGQAESCPVAQREAERILSLPLFPELTHAEADHVIDAVNAFGG